MKNLKKIALALGGLSAVCAGFAVGTVASTQKAAEPTLATATTQTTRRIYGIDHTNNFGWAYCMQSMCAHVWITGDSDAKDYTMSEIILKYDAANSPSGYYGGLFYVDIPVSYKYLIFLAAHESVADVY